MPSIRALCREHAASIVTCERALRSLERRGLIFAIPRVGFFVYPHRRRRHRVGPQAGARQRRIDWRCLLPNQDILSTIDLAGLIPRAVMRPSFYETLRAAPAGGERGLRAVIVRQLHLQGFGTDVDSVGITDGTMAVVLHALHVIDRPGAVVVQAPLCPALAEVLRLSGRPVIELDMLASAAGVHQRLQDILDQDPAVAAVMIAPSCHPISGRSLRFGDSLACYRLCVAHGIPLIVDDSMRYLLPVEELPAPFKAIDDHDLIIQHASLTRFLTPGLAVGWVFGGRWHQALMASLACLHPSPPAMVQQVTTALFNHKRVLEGRSAQALECQRLTRFMADALVARCPPETDVYRPDGGPHLCLRLPSGLEAAAVCAAAAAAGLLLNPGTGFSLTGLYRDCLILGSNIDSESMRHGARVLGHVVRSLVNGE